MQEEAEFGKSFYCSHITATLAKAAGIQSIDIAPANKQLKDQRDDEPRTLNEFKELC